MSEGTFSLVGAHIVSSVLQKLAELTEHYMKFRLHLVHCLMNCLPFSKLGFWNTLKFRHLVMAHVDIQQHVQLTHLCWVDFSTTTIWTCLFEMKRVSGQILLLHVFKKIMALFSARKCWYFSYFVHKNLCCGYSLEAPKWGASNEYPQHYVFVTVVFLTSNHKICFRGEISKLFWIPSLSRAMLRNQSGPSQAKKCLWTTCAKCTKTDPAYTKSITWAFALRSWIL